MTNDNLSIQKIRVNPLIFTSIKQQLPFNLNTLILTIVIMV